MGATLRRAVIEGFSFAPVLGGLEQVLEVRVLPDGDEGQDSRSGV